ncbi:hypothetical protein K0M31_011988 [Melipona bicolor]|uniref:Uncharacterized protein n=1 Tax=Melipona bicolor TaxID=60889 RepID=A0AA40GAU6_9HYME|nr:hypothetical protein K0M31_011988 [Melipona bicolor]
MPPSLIAAVLRAPKPVCPSALQDTYIQFAYVCVHEPRSYPGSPIGPRGASSVSDWTGTGSISAHPRVCASTTIIAGAVLSKMVDSDAPDVVTRIDGH